MLKSNSRLDSRPSIPYPWPHPLKVCPGSPVSVRTNIIILEDEAFADCTSVGTYVSIIPTDAAPDHAVFHNVSWMKPLRHTLEQLSVVSTVLWPSQICLSPTPTMPDDGSLTVGCVYMVFSTKDYPQAPQTVLDLILTQGCTYNIVAFPAS